MEGKNLVMLCVLFFVLHKSSGVVITVGDSLGWTNFDLSTQRVPDYAAWAASQPVAPGDSVVFRYSPGFHNVAMLPSKTDFDNCNFAKASMLDSGSSGNFTWIAPQKSGVYYFACGISVEGQGTHCDGGQKVSITVGLAATPSPSPLANSPLEAPTPAGLVLGPALAPSTSSPSPSRGGPISAAPVASPQIGLVPSTSVPPVAMEPSGSGGSALVPVAADDDNTSDGVKLVSVSHRSLIVAIALLALRLF